MDDFQGLPCRVGQPDEGLIELTYGVASGPSRPVSLACASTKLVTLSVTKSGSGTVTGGAINCGAACTQAFAPETAVILTATAGSGYQFTGWDGACAGTAPTCVIPMDGDRAVHATFTQLFQLTVDVRVSNSLFATVTGGASVSPPNLNENPCMVTDDVGFKECRGLFLAGSTVTVSQAGDSRLNGWDGACVGTASTCVITMTGDQLLTGRFNF